MNEKNRLVSIIALLVANVFVTSVLVSAQEFPSNLSTNTPPPPLPTTPATSPALQQSNAGNNTGGMASVPSLENRPMASRARASTSANFQLPKDDGQYWVEYDLKPYTRNLTKVEQPQQAIIDWILRETGTDVWFSQPMGVLNADRDTLRVYHNQAMQKTVSEIYERFVNGSTDPQVFGMRLITINNPNWRTRAAGWMKSVQVQSPGVHAWLLSKENTALLLAMLRGRSDYREVQAGDITINNGQTQTLEQLRSRNYVREYRRTEQGWPPYVPDSAEIQEGYRLQMSPLLSIDHRMVDVALKCNIDQVERLNSVNIELPLPTGQIQPAQIQVPQVVSWRLHERFRWSSDQVLLLSCGVIAAPSGAVNNTLLGQGAGAIGLSRIIPPTAGGDRADALLILEYKGDNSTQLTPTQPPMVEQAQRASVSRGRY